MKNILRVLGCVFLISSLLIMTLSCSAKDSYTCKDIIEKMLATCEGSGGKAGELYFEGALEGEEGFFSPSLMRDMYADQGVARMAGVEDFAIFVSAREPFEIAIFKCFSTDDVEAVTLLCLGRRDLIRVSLRNTRWSEQTSDIRVCSSGRYVLFAFCDNNKRAEEMFLGML